MTIPHAFVPRPRLPMKARSRNPAEALRSPPRPTGRRSRRCAGASISVRLAARSPRRLLAGTLVCAFRARRRSPTGADLRESSAGGNFPQSGRAASRTPVLAAPPPVAFAARKPHLQSRGQQGVFPWNDHGLTSRCELQLTTRARSRPMTRPANLPFEPTLDSTLRLALPCLACDIDALAPELPELSEDMDRLIEQNFQSELFVSPEMIDRETEERLQAVLRPRITIPTQSKESQEDPDKPDSSQAHPFA